MDKTSGAMPTFSDISHRLLGVGIVIKALLPAFIVLLMLIGVFQLTHHIGLGVKDAQKRLEPKLSQATEELREIKSEVTRLHAEVSKIKNKTSELAGDIEKSIEPLRKSLLGVANSLDFISDTIESILNGVISIVNKLPGKDLKKIRLPSVKIPGFKLPDFDVDIDLEPDLEAIKNFQVHVDEISIIVGESMVQIGQAIVIWFKLMTVVLMVVGFWLFLFIFSYCIKTKVKVMVGIELIRGKSVDNAVLYF